MRRVAKEAPTTSLRPLYARSMIQSLGSGTISPYVSVYAVQLGASTSEMGWLRSLPNLLGSVTQVPWGGFIDKAGRRVPFILVGGALTSLLWLPMLYVKDPWQIIIITAAQAFLGSIVAPAWAALIGDLVPHTQRGGVTATINAAASLGSMAATLASGYIMTTVTGSLSEMYRWPIVMATVCGLTASFTMLTMRERRGEGKAGRGWAWALHLRRVGRDNPYFRTYCLVGCFQGFFMAMAWPLFSITIVKVLKADMVQVAYLNVIMGAVSLVVRRFTGRLVDKAGRKPLIVLGRTGIFLVPVVYALATNVYHLFAVEAFIGLFFAMSEIATFAYLLDTMPAEQKASLTAVYNTVTGILTFLGSVIGGYLASFLVTQGLSEPFALQMVYALSASGRFVGGLLYLRLKEPYEYPSTLKEELTHMIAEDVERLREGAERIERKAEDAERGLEKDFEWLEGWLGWRKTEER